jgi:predicted small lipoprotein YifL
VLVPRYRRTVTRAALLFGLAACGRFGFGTDSPPSDANAIDTAIDAPTVPCGPIETPPADVHVTGFTFRYISFDNDRTIMTGVSVAASRTVDGPAIATTISDAAGAYDLAVPTGGVADTVVLRYTTTNEFTTIAVLDRVLDRDVVGPNGDVLQLGDGPIWNAGQMGSIYSAAGLVRDPLRSMVNISVRDCLGFPIAGAVVDIQPPPEATIYQANDGRPTAGVVETQSRYGQAFGMNALGTTTTITVTHPTRRFAPITVEVVAGAVNMLVVARAID